MKTKEFIVAIIFTLISLGLYVIFPAKDVFQQIITMLIFLILLPLFFNKYVLRNSKLITGFKIGDYKKGIFYSGISLIICFIIIVIQSYYFNFLNKYSVPKFITESFLKFLLYEFFLVLPFVVMYEFYFRGFLMSLFDKKIGYWSIPLQSIIFTSLIMFSSGKLIQFVPYLVFSIFSGWIVLKSKSLIYSATAQFILIFILNVIIIKRLG